jgi:hypothetical protein
MQPQLPTNFDSVALSAGAVKAHSSPKQHHRGQFEDSGTQLCETHFLPFSRFDVANALWF